MPDFWFGCLKDPEDRRDYTFRAIRPAVLRLQPEVDLRKLNLITPVRDQDGIGCCTGFATASLKEFLERQRKWRAKPILSPLYIYYEARRLGNLPLDQDTGAHIRDAMKVLDKLGAPAEKSWPYIVDNFDDDPPNKVDNGALFHRINTYNRINGLLEMKECLSSGRAFVLGFVVYQSFFDTANMAQGWMPMPSPGEQVYGGHAVLCVGLKNDPAIAGGGYLIIKNSWGVNVHDRGYFYLPYAFANSSDCWDCWTASS